MKTFYQEKTDRFNSEIAPHYPFIKMRALQFTGQEPEAEDLTQETFLSAFKYIEGFRSGTDAKSWLFIILKNKFINQQKRTSTKADYSNSFETLEGANFGDGECIRVDEPKGAFGDPMAKALESLSAERRFILILRDIEGYSYQEIASLVGVPLEHIRNKLNRARNKVRSLVADYAREQGYVDKRKPRCKSHLKN